MNHHTDTQAPVPSFSGQVPAGEAVPRGVEYHPPQGATGMAADARGPGLKRTEPSKVKAIQAAVHALRTPEERATLPEFDAAAYALMTSRRPPSHGAPAALSSRVDWFTSAFKVDLCDGVLEQLLRRLDNQERAAVQIGGMPFELRRMQTGKKLLARNADVGVVIDAEGPDGWTVQVDFPGATMMRTGLDEAVALARNIARGLGKVKGERVRRLDLCADISHWYIGDIDAEGWVKPSRARLERASVRDLEKSWEHPEMRQYRRGANITGYTICPGNELTCVVYDKREELTIRVDKREAEEETWKANGWDGNSAVTRVEFRLRSEVLHELGVRDGLDAFRRHLDALWAYCTRVWVRLVVRSSAERLSRCDVDHAWTAVRDVKFKHQADPAARCRVRGGASAAHAFGSVLSFQGREKALPCPHEVVDDTTGEVLDEDGIVARLDEDGARKLVHGRVAGLFTAAASRIAEEIIERFGAIQGAAFVLFREGATRARFSSVTVAESIGLALAAA